MNVSIKAIFSLTEKAQREQLIKLLEEYIVQLNPILYHLIADWNIVGEYQAVHAFVRQISLHLSTLYCYKLPIIVSEMTRSVKP